GRHTGAPGTYDDDVIRLLHVTSVGVNYRKTVTGSSMTMCPPSTLIRPP
ncbi:MAG: hypothetical protein QOJ72_2437, partial [Nocardioidaceae bacterium]|nr:hypothetical protein [Nocardioidaceae bacterium]